MAIMTERIPIDPEFLRRALGLGSDGDPATVKVTQDALPADFPLKLPFDNGRILGGIRSAAPGWTFQFDGQAVEPYQPKWQWRAFLDVASPPHSVLAELISSLNSQGWQAVTLFQPVFVEAEQSQWMAVHAGKQLQLTARLRLAGQLTQLGLEVFEVDENSIRHLLGQHAFPYPHDHFEAPLPSLLLPVGWQARMEQGSGGPVRSQQYRLLPPAGAPTDLWPHLQPQFERQGWHLLHHEPSLSVFRTALGVGTLHWQAQEGQGINAVIVHVTAEKGMSSNSSYVITSNG